jgi:uncharacterized protein YjbI with pentapeptide repeats
LGETFGEINRLITLRGVMAVRHRLKFYQGRKKMRNKSVAAAGMILVCFLLVGATAFGFNKDHLKQLQDTNKCQGCDLSNANLSGASLRGAWLGMANLRGTDLSGADLRRLQARSVKLDGAKLNNADFRDADLYFATMSKANLEGADLRGAYLGNADLRGANLRNAYLGGANLKAANLTGADLTNTSLSWAIWTNGKYCDGASVGKCNERD